MGADDAGDDDGQDGDDLVGVAAGDADDDDELGEGAAEVADPEAFALGHLATEEQDTDHQALDDVDELAPAENELVAVGVSGAASEPTWADGPVGTDLHDPVDRIVDPGATAVVPPVRIDDFAYPDLARPDSLGPDRSGVVPIDPEGSGRRRRRWPWIAAAIVILAGGGGVAAATVFDREPEPPAPTLVLPLPDLTNRSVDEARALITAGGWELAPLRMTREDNTMKGQVLEMDPAPGTRLALAGTITLTVSEGQNFYPVPLDALNDVSVEEATSVLLEAGFATNPEGATAHHEDVAEGDVISAVEGTGAEAERGSTIGLLISDGPAPRTVPSGLVGGTQAEAKAALDAVQLKMAVVGTFSDDIPEGQVISVLPKSGTTGLERGSSVNVEVSKGPELRAVPDISRADDLAEAVQILRAAGFQAGDVRGRATGSPRRTNPAAGTMARPGSSVDIIMG
jgi:beta-lactam-binding protein with PASTA domain